jgi:hypothetical protein
MIPQFPLFKTLELSDRESVEAHTNLFEPYSDFNFTCLWTWDTDEKRMVSELNGNLVVKFTDYRTHEPFLSFLGTHESEATAEKLIEYCVKENLPPTLRLVPPVSVASLNPERFSIEESSGDFDYILSAKNLSELAGNQFQRKREHANRFWRENPAAKIEPIDLKDKTVEQHIFETIKIWEHYKNEAKKEYELEHELLATSRLFKSDRLDSLLSVGLFLGESMLGYAIGEALPNRYALVHFLRSAISHKGVTEALMQGYAKHLAMLKIEHMNFESDLEFSNLRHYKTSWRPVFFLKRYNVRYVSA